MKWSDYDRSKVFKALQSAYMEVKDVQQRLFILHVWQYLIEHGEEEVE